jgi:hypothetical protein
VSRLRCSLTLTYAQPTVCLWLRWEMTLGGCTSSPRRTGRPTHMCSGGRERIITLRFVNPSLSRLVAGTFSWPRSLALDGQRQCADPFLSLYLLPLFGRVETEGTVSGSIKTCTMGLPPLVRHTITRSFVPLQAVRRSAGISNVMDLKCGPRREPSPSSQGKWQGRKGRIGGLYRVVFAPKAWCGLERFRAALFRHAYYRIMALLSHFFALVSCIPVFMPGTVRMFTLQSRGTLVYGECREQRLRTRMTLKVSEYSASDS